MGSPTAAAWTVTYKRKHWYFWVACGVERVLGQLDFEPSGGTANSGVSLPIRAQQRKEPISRTAETGSDLL
jgi:hypothetical protein